MKPVKPPFTYRSVDLASGVQLRWMIFRRCLSSSSSPRSPRYPKIYESQTTAHSITDDVCPPTDRNLLEGTVTKNIESFERWLTMKPLAQHTVDAFQIALEFHQNHQQGYGQEKAIILDSGCGTGRSTRLLAEMYPDQVVVGVDRSAARLSKQPTSPLPSNALLIRAELVDFWRCCSRGRIPIDRHYLLYPNPNPKPSLLTKRWYAHPSFPLLLQLGTQLTVRSNWKAYLDEFAVGVGVVATATTNSDGIIMSVTEPITPVQQRTNGTAWTNFEAKFHDCGEPTYELVVHRQNQSP